MVLFALRKDHRTLHISWTSVDVPLVLKEANIVSHLKF